MRGSTLAAAALLTCAAAWVPTTQAAADVREGHCNSDTGVTLVVDFQDLGGGTVIRCVEDVSPGTTGLEVLELAGMAPAGTLRDGPAFVCRINDRPGVNETIAVDGDPNYRERCGSTPPRTAFWSYWYATNGGPWTFSQAGTSNRAAIIGGYEGWSFSLNKSHDANPSPRVTPSHPVVQPSTAPVPASSAPPPAPITSAPPATAGPAPSTAPATSAPVAVRPSVAVPPAGTAPATTTTARPARTQAATSNPPSAAPTSAAPATSVAPTASTSATTMTPVAAPSPSSSAVSPAMSATSTPSPAPPVDALPGDDPSVPTGTLMGAGAVAVLGAAGGVVWWRRRAL